MHRGYIKIWRKIIDSGLQDNLEIFGFFTNLVIMANHKEKKFLLNGNFVNVARGSLITGRNSLAKKFNISPSKAWRMIDILKRGEIIDIQSNNRYSTVSICNYNKYQDIDYKIKHHTRQVPDSKRTSTGQVPDTNNNDKNVKNDNNVNKSLSSSELIYNAYPRKVGKIKAIEAIEKSLEKSSFLVLDYKVKEYAKSVKGEDHKFIPHASTWFNQERWQDPIERTPEQLEDEKQKIIWKRQEEEKEHDNEQAMSKEEWKTGIKDIVSDLNKKVRTMD